MSLHCNLTGHHVLYRDQPRSAVTSLFHSLSQATSEEEKTVLVTIRGTAQVEDVVTDLCCAPDVRRRLLTLLCCIFLKHQRSTPILCASQQVLIPNYLSRTCVAICIFNHNHFIIIKQDDSVVEIGGDGAPGALGHAPERALAQGSNTAHPQGTALRLAGVHKVNARKFYQQRRTGKTDVGG